MSPDAYIEMAATETEHWWFVARRKILEDTLRSMELPADAQILEVGSGTGGNLDMLSQFGSVSALEMDEAARQFAREKTAGNIDIKEGVCPNDMPFQDRKFDLICLFDVLEHIDEDTETLAVLKTMLTPTGKILVTVPAYQWMWSAHDAYLHHHRRYSATEFKSKAARAELNVKRLSHFNTLLLPLAILVRLKDRIIKRSTPTGGAVPIGPLNRLFTIIFRSESALLSRMNLPAGLSLMGILEAN